MIKSIISIAFVLQLLSILIGTIWVIRFKPWYLTSVEYRVCGKVKVYDFTNIVFYPSYQSILKLLLKKEQCKINDIEICRVVTLNKTIKEI